MSLVNRHTVSLKNKIAKSFQVGFEIIIQDYPEKMRQGQANDVGI